MTARYEPPEDVAPLTKEEIRKRYQDTSLIIFKEQENRKETSYLSYGSSRRTMEYSSNGNQPVIVRRPVRQHSMRDDLSSQIARISRKPRESCVIS